MMIPSISVEELKTLRDSKKKHLLLDVREPSEHEAARIEGAKLIPMGEVPKRVGELPKDCDLIVHCHHGGRSARVVGFLQGQGFTNAKNLDGGIDAWSERVDPSVPRY